ncbi:MAG: LysE family transporter, partial [Oscillospiraceae bacterium]
MSVFINGFLCGLAYVCPIGMQNSFVINNAVKNKTGYSYILAVITTFFDILLAVACFYGIGYIFEIFPQYKNDFITVGGIFVIFMGVIIMFSKTRDYK